MDERYREEREAFLSEASAEMDEGRYDDAIVRADARLRNMPGDMDAFLVRASCLARMGRPTEAAELVEEWDTLLREQSLIYETLGDAYRRTGMTEDAVRSYERFMELNVGTGEARRVSEKIGALRDDAREGEGADEPGAVSDDFQTMTLARLYVKQGHFRMAEGVIETILERDPDNHEAREYAGHIRRLIDEGWGPVVVELNRWLSELRAR